MRTLAHAVLAVLAVVMLPAGSRAAEKPLYDKTFFEPSEEVVTPHIPWFKPLHGPKPKVLFITHRNAMREVIELAQRLDMDYRVFACESPRKFGETGLGVDSSWKLIRGNSAEELATRLRQDLAQDYDVFVVGNVAWDQLPLDCRYEILRKVKAGTGLVGYMPSGRDEYIARILGDNRFHWTYGLWSGGIKDNPDYFGLGVFESGVDFATAHTGKAALRILCKEARKGNREDPRAGYSPGQIKLEPETEYVFSMWTRTEGLQTGGASVSLNPQAKGVAVPASADWVRTEAKFRTGKGEQTTGVYLLNYKPGTVWYDDVSLTKAGTTENLLPNPGFERPGPAPAGVADGVPFRSLPAFRTAQDATSFLGSTLETREFGQGRIALVQYGVPIHQMMTPGPGGRVQDCQLDYDYYLAFAIKLILWGARRDPLVAPDPAQEPLFTRAQSALRGNPIEVRAVASRALVYWAEVTIRDRRNRVWHASAQEVALQAGSNRVKFALGELPRGSYFVDTVWRDSRRGAVVGVQSAGLEVSGDTGLTSLTLDKESFALSEPLTGKALIEKPLPGCSLRLEARDLHGRLVAEDTLPAQTGEIAFSLPLPPALTPVGWLTATVVAGAETLDTRTVDYSISDLPLDRRDAMFVMWESYPPDFIGPAMGEEFRRNGVDAMYGGAGTPGYAPFADQRWLPYATRFTDSKTDWYQVKASRQPGDLVRTPCLTDPKYRESVRASLVKTATAGLKSSTVDFTLGDENLFVSGDFDLCFSDTCVADFRTWAQQDYGGALDKLNRTWGTAFTSWDEVRPQTLDECRKTGRFAPWIDHRRHMESVWADIHAFGRDAVRSVNPNARVGYEGSDTHVGSFHAADYWKLSKAMDLNNIYYRDFLSLAWYDFAAPGTLLGAGWFGGYAGNRNEPFMRWFPWRALLKGSNSFWVWNGYGSAGSVMAFDLSLYPFFKAACQEVAEIKSGPGKLLITARRAHDGIALLYSPSSVHVATCTPMFPAMDTTLQAMVMLLHDSGLECRVLSYAELAAGKLTNEEFKVLILPGAQALSGAEVDSIVTFVEGGGFALADLRPGTTDEHGAPWPERRLDALFGVAQNAAFKKVEAALAEAELANLPCDGSLQVGAGHAEANAGMVPLLVGNQAGKGRTLLLNFAVTAYQSLPQQKGAEFADWASGAPWRRFLRRRLDGAGVKAAVTVQPELPHLEVSRFRNGALEYVGLVQSLPYPTLDYTNRKVPTPPAKPVRVDFGRKSYLYDVRAGKYLGETATIETPLAPGIAQLYALLPYRLGTLAVRTPAEAKSGSAAAIEVGLKARGNAPLGAHVVRVQVFDPTGKEQPWYGRNLLCESGHGSLTLTFALSDPPGKWRVTVRDVATGVAESATLKVTAAAARGD